MLRQLNAIVVSIRDAVSNFVVSFCRFLTVFLCRKLFQSLKLFSETILITEIFSETVSPFHILHRLKSMCVGKSQLKLAKEVL